MWVDPQRKHEPGSGTDASNADDEATNEGGEFRGGRGGPHKENRDDGVRDPMVEVPAYRLGGPQDSRTSPTPT